MAAAGAVLWCVGCCAGAVTSGARLLRSCVRAGPAELPALRALLACGDATCSREECALLLAPPAGWVRWPCACRHTQADAGTGLSAAAAEAADNRARHHTAHTHSVSSARVFAPAGAPAHKRVTARCCQQSAAVGAVCCGCECTPVGATTAQPVLPGTRARKASDTVPASGAVWQAAMRCVARNFL
jgi:hypothetical protein